VGTKIKRQRKTRGIIKGTRKKSEIESKINGI
jgi:hypothetical protein